MSSLNSPQIEAVTHTEGPLLVVAGAGSGKTRVIVERIVHLLSSGISEEKILALTFTNKAAKEMKERIFARTAQNILALTFHSFGAMILREAGSSIGICPGFVIYDTEESLHILQAALTSLDLDSDRSSAKKYRESISSLKNQLIKPEELCSCNPAEALLQKIYTRYSEKLKECGALDFDDLLFLTHNLLTGQGEVAAHYQERFSHLLVDEYQDTNHAQYQIVRALCKKHSNICVVGDPDQSIYSWRGADLHNILRFEKDFPNAKRVTLDINYRSTQTILDAANRLIRNNRHRLEKKLHSAVGGGNKIQHLRFSDDRAEALYIARLIQTMTQIEGVPRHEIAIFYRTNAQSRTLEEALLSFQIPYVIYGGLSFYQRKEIKDLVAWLKIFYLPSDQVAFERTFSLEKRGVGKATLEKIFSLASALEKPILELVREIVDGFHPAFKLSNKQQKGFSDYLFVLQNLNHLKDSPYSLLIELTNKSRYEEHLKAFDPNTVQERKENLWQLQKKALEWEASRKEGDEGFLFLQEIALVSAMSESDSLETSKVQLMTLHNAKGLEFDVCFMTGMEDMLFPHTSAFESPGGLEEERRLCYVGITRAKKQLFTTRVSSRFLWGTFRTMAKSCFLEEMG